MSAPFFPSPPVPPLAPPLGNMAIGVPAGAVMAFAGKVSGKSQDEDTTTLETYGWMVCDGRELDVSAYPELFAAIGYQYSKSSGGEKFAIPDLRGYFLRGVDEGQGVDPDTKDRYLVNGTKSTEVGSIQDCALQKHEHNYSQAIAASQPSQQGTEAGTIQALTKPTSGIVPPEGSTQTVFTSEKETRAKNVYVYFIIKFTNGPFPWTTPLGQMLGG